MALQDDFERLTTGVFSTVDEQRFNKQLAGPFLEPLFPGREELLEHFDVVLEQMVSAQTDEARRRHRQRFLTSMAGIRELEQGMPIRLTDVASCITEIEPGKIGFGLFREPVDLIGHFGCIDIGPWFDVVPGEDLPDDDGKNPFLRQYGLLVYLQDTVIEVGREVHDLPGLTRIPLNHGSPELFRVHYPQ